MLTFLKWIFFLMDPPGFSQDPLWGSTPHVEAPYVVCACMCVCGWNLAWSQGSANQRAVWGKHGCQEEQASSLPPPAGRFRLFVSVFLDFGILLLVRTLFIGSEFTLKYPRVRFYRRKQQRERAPSDRRYTEQSDRNSARHLLRGMRTGKSLLV